MLPDFLEQKKSGGKRGIEPSTPAYESGRLVDRTLAINHLPRASVAEYLH